MEEVDIKKEEILTELDYAIKCFRELQSLIHDNSINPKSYENYVKLLKDIEKLVKEY